MKRFIGKLKKGLLIFMASCMLCSNVAVSTATVQVQAFAIPAGIALWEIIMGLLLSAGVTWQTVELFNDSIDGTSALDDALDNTSRDILDKYNDWAVLNGGSSSNSDPSKPPVITEAMIYALIYSQAIDYPEPEPQPDPEPEPQPDPEPEPEPQPQPDTEYRVNIPEDYAGWINRYINEEIVDIADMNKSSIDYSNPDYAIPGVITLDEYYELYNIDYESCSSGTKTALKYILSTFNYFNQIFTYCDDTNIYIYSLYDMSNAPKFFPNTYTAIRCKPKSYGEDFVHYERFYDGELLEYDAKSILNVHLTLKDGVWTAVKPAGSLLVKTAYVGKSTFSACNVDMDSLSHNVVRLAGASVYSNLYRMQSYTIPDNVGNGWSFIANRATRAAVNPSFPDVLEFNKEIDFRLPDKDVLLSYLKNQNPDTETAIFSALDVVPVYYDYDNGYIYPLVGGAEAVPIPEPSEPGIIIPFPGVDPNIVPFPVPDPDPVIIPFPSKPTVVPDPEPEPDPNPDPGTDPTEEPDPDSTEEPNPGVTPNPDPGTDPTEEPDPDSTEEPGPDSTEEPNPGTNPGTDPGTNPGTDPGTNPGTDPGTNPGTDPGTNPGTDPGTNPGTDPGTNPGTDPGTNPGTEPGTNPGTNPGTDPGTNPGTDPGTGTDWGEKADEKFAKSSAQIKTVFPFCIPFDLYDSYHAMIAEQRAPVWETDLKFDWLGGYTYHFVVDMSDYEEEVEIFRWGVLLMFIVGLMFGTHKLIKWKES